MEKDIDEFLLQNPLVKAKEIAKELGLTRKEVNSFLHSHADKYHKGSNFRWQLISDGKFTLLLPEGWVTADEFEEIFQAAGPLFDYSCQEVVVIFSAGCKTMVDCIARLLALINQLVFIGKTVTIDFTGAGQTKTYLNRAGFFDLLHQQVAVLPGRPKQSAAKRYQGQSDTLVEFGKVDPGASNEDLIEQLTNTFVQQSSVDYRVAALTVFGELIGNVTEHSESPIHGFAGLQKYGGRNNHIQTVVSDSGVGIANTLRPSLAAHYPVLHRRFGQQSLESDIGLVKAAMSEGQVSRFGGARGLGFKSSREQATKFNAHFSVRQKRFCLKFEFRDGVLVNVHKQLDLPSLLGTHICFDFYVD